MDLLSLSSFPAALLVWQLTPSRWVITVVCKATYSLVPGVVAIAPEQEPIQEVDAHWDDDPKRSLFAPADLVPFKPRADVMLVGSAYARNGQPARSIIVRLNVGKIDKSIEVLCPRVRTRDGELREGKRWTKMPLLYERAAGGPGTDNPVGISFEGARDPYGQLALPNLQAPGLNLPIDKLPPPIGFGPIAAEWPGRVGRIPKAHEDRNAGPSSSGALPRDWARAPFGEGFDPAYFQAAPADQQIDSLRLTERIALDNLLAKHPVFVSSLPGDKIRARVETRGVAPREVSLVPDSLWIDTDRAICTVTYRGKIDVEHPEQEGRILVAATRTDQPIPWARLAPAPPPPSSQSSPPPPAAKIAPQATSSVANMPVANVPVANVPVPGPVTFGLPPAPPPAASATVPSAPLAGPAPRVPVPGTVVSPVAVQKAPPPPGRISTPPAPVVPVAPGVKPRSTPPPRNVSPSGSGEPLRNIGPSGASETLRNVSPSGSSEPLRNLAPSGALEPPRFNAPPLEDEPPDSRDEPRTVDIEIDAIDAVEVTMTEHPGRVLTQTAALRPITAPGTLLVSDVPALPFQPAPPGYTPPAAKPSRPGLPPLPGVPTDFTTTPAFGAPLSRGTLPDWSDSPPSPPAPPADFAHVAPPPLITSPAWNALTPSKPVPLGGAPPIEGPLGALEASNAAAGLRDSTDRSPEPGRPEIESSPTPQPSGPAAVVELIWFDPAAPLRFARHPLFAVFKRSPSRATEPARGKPEPNDPVRGGKPEPGDPARGKPDASAEAPEEPSNSEDLARGWVYDTITRTAPAPAGTLESLLESAEDESPPQPALAVVTGTLELGLDEVEMLRAVAAAASPLAASDKKLKEVLDVAAEMLKTPMQGMPDFAEGLSARIRESWARANRALPPDHLASCTERLLLEQRAYQKRELLDDAWIRALLSGDGPSVPVYLPAKIAKRLPLFRRFPVRLIAEVLWQQDQYETHPLALRTLALGRLSGRQRKKKAGDGGRSR